MPKMKSKNASRLFESSTQRVTLSALKEILSGTGTATMPYTFAPTPIGVAPKVMLPRMSMIARSSVSISGVGNSTAWIVVVRPGKTELPSVPAMICEAMSSLFAGAV